jgi:hypothetical protein
MTTINVQTLKFALTFMAFALRWRLYTPFACRRDMHFILTLLTSHITQTRLESRKVLQVHPSSQPPCEEGFIDAQRYVGKKFVLQLLPREF